MLAMDPLWDTQYTGQGKNLKAKRHVLAYLEH